MYVSQHGHCGQNKLMHNGHDFGWGEGYVERNPVTDCRMCADTTPHGTIASSRPDVGASQGQLPLQTEARPAAERAIAAQPGGVWRGDRYCEGDVCVKGPPNCFGAKGGADEDCRTCSHARRAYAERGWAWLGGEPDAALFCKKWP
jgi:hypothetical protein